MGLKAAEHTVFQGCHITLWFCCYIGQQNILNIITKVGDN